MAKDYLDYLAYIIDNLFPFEVKKITKINEFAYKKYYDGTCEIFGIFRTNSSANELILPFNIKIETAMIFISASSYNEGLEIAASHFRDTNKIYYETSINGVLASNVQVYIKIIATFIQ